MILVVLELLIFLTFLLPFLLSFCYDLQQLEVEVVRSYYIPFGGKSHFGTEICRAGFCLSLSIHVLDRSPITLPLASSPVPGPFVLIDSIAKPLFLMVTPIQHLCLEDPHSSKSLPQGSLPISLSSLS